eukprot:Hpha_TRINITY_DN30845_c0_g1::TRINITY_DN30845_c0_g1_i1::g.155546::m.155546
MVAEAQTAFSNDELWRAAAARLHAAVVARHSSAAARLATESAEARALTHAISGMMMTAVASGLPEGAADEAPPSLPHEGVSIPLHPYASAECASRTLAEQLPYPFGLQRLSACDAASEGSGWAGDNSTAGHAEPECRTQ